MDVNALKRFVGRTPFQKLSMDIKANLELSKFSNIDDRVIGNSTIYCISPYKTATKYLNSCYNDEVSSHEALHYLTLKQLEKNFDNFFIRRLNTLNLKLETSGFLSAYIDELASNPITKNLNYIVITRTPSSWITSAINYFDSMNKKMRMNMHYPNVLFFKNKIGVDLDTILNLPEKERNLSLDRLGEFYLNFTKKTKKLKNVHYVDINEIDSFLPILDDLIEEKSQTIKNVRNAFNEKSYTYKNYELDREYEKIISELKNQNK